MRSQPFSAMLVDVPSAGGEDLLRAELARISIGCIDVVKESEARTLFASNHLPLVFVNLESANFNPAELIRAFVKEYPEVLVVLVSSLVNQQVVIEAMQAGGTEVAKKPLQEGEIRALLARVVGLLNRRRYRYFDKGVLHAAELKLKLQSSQLAITPAVSAIVGLLTGVTQRREIQRLELALDEMIRNAHEHGNLGISSVAKHRALEEGSYESLVEQRVNEGFARGKVIEVTANLADNVFCCTITDQGEGFDWRALLAKEPSPEDLLNPGGRGLLLMKQIFDTVVFNEIGNSVSVSKSFV